MNSNTIVEYMEQHGESLMMEFYDLTDEQADFLKTLDWDCFEQYDEDPDFRQYVEESCAESINGADAREDGMRHSMEDGSISM